MPTEQKPSERIAEISKGDLGNNPMINTIIRLNTITQHLDEVWEKEQLKKFPLLGTCNVEKKENKLSKWLKTTYTVSIPKSMPHIPVVGEHCFLGGLEFEVKEVYENWFRTISLEERADSQDWRVSIAAAFTWPEPKPVWTQAHYMEMIEEIDSQADSDMGLDPRGFVLTFIKSRISKDKKD